MDVVAALRFGSRRDLPVLLQTEAAECGLASLGMVACFHGHRIDLAGLRQRFTVSLKGATLAYLMSTLGAGLFVSTMSNSQQQAFLGGFLFMMPAMLLSGNMTPLAAVPEWLVPLTYFNPLRYYIQVLRGSLLRGAGWPEMWPQLLALTAMGAVILTLSSLRFRKTLA